MHTKTTTLTLALPLALTLALGIPAYAQQPMQPAGQPSNQATPTTQPPSPDQRPPVVPVAPTGGTAAPPLQTPPLRAKAPAGCMHWVTDGQQGLSIIEARIKFRHEQLQGLMAALAKHPKDKKLSREESDSLKATEARLKALEVEMKCDDANRNAFIKENLGRAKDKASEVPSRKGGGGSGTNDTTSNLTLEQTQDMMKEIYAKLQQIMQANADANRDTVKKLK